METLNQKSRKINNQTSDESQTIEGKANLNPNLEEIKRQIDKIIEVRSSILSSIRLKNQIMTQIRSKTIKQIRTTNRSTKKNKENN